MLAGIRDRLTYANVMASLAVFVALGAGAYAAGLAPDSVKSKHIVDRQVKPADIARPGAVRSVGPGSDTQDLCADASNTAVFCSQSGAGWLPWHNVAPNDLVSAGFYKDQLGVVHLRGVVSAGQAITYGNAPNHIPIFRLPGAYRPTRQHVFSTVGGSMEFRGSVLPARVDVHPDGRVVFVQDCDADASDCSSAGGVVSLDGISFRRDE